MNEIYKKYIEVQRDVPGNILSSKLTDYFNPNNFDGLQKKTLPRKLILDTINICNANCVFCAYQFKKDKNQIMSLDFIDKVTKDYAQFHPESFVTFTPTVGDPLIDKDIFKKVDIAKTNGIKRVQFYTNGILLKHKIDELFNSQIDNLEISFPDFENEIYNEIFRTNKYPEALEGLHLLLKMNKEGLRKLPIKINIRGKRPLEIIKSTPDFQEYIKPYLTDYIFITETPSFDNWMGMIEQNHLPKGMKLAEQQEAKIDKPCLRLFDLQVLANGDLRLCGCRFKDTVFDDLVFGNLKDKSLKDLWFSSKAFEMRSKFFSNDLPGACKSCSYYEAIGSKEKRRYFTGDKD